jgi:hypothetical protein
LCQITYLFVAMRDQCWVGLLSTICLSTIRLFRFTYTQGGANAIYYDLVANEEGKLSHIEVRIETSLTIIREALRTRPLLVGS